MNEKPSKIDLDLKALRDFLTDIKCLDPIKIMADKFNIFDVFGFAKNEIRHSFVLRWLLDPKENHGLGDSVIKKLLRRLISLDPGRYENNAFDLLMMDCSDFTVQREIQNIDLLLLSKNNGVAIVIENKIGSHEHSSTGYDSQLDKYRDYIEHNIEMRTKIYIYLTPQNESPSDEDNWQTLSYTDIVEILEETYKEHSERLSPDIKTLINNYIEILRRDIVENIELDELCKKIYSLHKRALDLIYEHSDMGMNPIIKAISNTLKEYSQKGLVDYEEKDRITFHTPTMTNYLPKLETESSSWNSRYTYNYWFKIRDDRVCFVFEIGYWGLTDELVKKMDGLFNTRHPKNKKASDKYKRLESFRWIDLSESSEEEMLESIKEIIDKVLIEEKIWIKECEDYINNLG